MIRGMGRQLFHLLAGWKNQVRGRLHNHRLSWRSYRVYRMAQIHLRVGRLFRFLVSHRKSLRLCGWLGLTLLLFLGIYQFFWVIPNQQIAAQFWQPRYAPLTSKELYELRNNIRQTFVQVLGGAVLLLGLYFTAQTLRISQETLRINQEGQITERFSKAIDHLGDQERLAVRLGGIYALERIARDSPQDQWQIMAVLTAYVRDNAPWPPRDAPSRQQPAADIQAALTVLTGRTWVRGQEEQAYKIPLYRTDLRGAQLEGAMLVNAQLEGANLAGAHLEKANLAVVHLRQANLANAYLEEAHLPFAHMEGANLAGAHLERAFLAEAYLEGADFRGADLEGTFLQHAHLEGANITVEQLSAVRTLRGASLDSSLKDKLQAAISAGQIPPSLLQG